MKKIVKLLLPIIATFFLLWYLFRQTTLSDISATFQKSSPLYMLIGFGLYILCNILRGMRFKFLIKEKIPSLTIINIAFVNNMANNMFPAKTGEVSYPYLLKKSGISLPMSLSSLLVARLYDFIALSFIFLLTLFFAVIPFALPKEIMVITGSILIIAIILVSLVIYGNHALKKIIKKLFKGRLYEEKVLEIFDLSGEHRAKTGSLLVVSVLLWIINFTSLFFILQSLHIAVTIWQTFFICIFYVFLPLLPFNGIAGFGTAEAYWSAMFILFGISQEIAIVSSFSFHIINVLYFVLPGLYGLYALRKSL